MPIAFTRTKLHPGVRREEYEQWIADFVYPQVERIRSVLSYRIYSMRDLDADREDAGPYDYVEVIRVSSLDAYRDEVKHNPAAMAIARELAKWVEVLDALSGESVAPGFDRPASAPLSESAAPVGTTTLTWHAVQHIVDASVYECPEIPDVIISGGRSNGIALFDVGARPEVATMAVVFFSDSLKDSGVHRLYTAYRFEDTSGFVTLSDGTATASAERRAVSLAGNLKFVRGTGRFTGITGEGTYKGHRLASAQDADAYFECSAVYTISSTNSTRT